MVNKAVQLIGIYGSATYAVPDTFPADTLTIKLG
jgi:hypothetical protein